MTPLKVLTDDQIDDIHLKFHGELPTEQLHDVGTENCLLSQESFRRIRARATAEIAKKKNK